MSPVHSSARVLQALSRHRGRDRGASIVDLVREITGRASTAADERALRRTISELREEGTPVCGHPKTGYFIAQTPDELDQCCAFLRSRAMHSLKLEARLRRMPLQALLGQLNVET